MNIRFAHPDELDQIAAVEAACFPPSEAATRDSLKWRLETFPNSFLVAIEPETQRIIGIINGAVTDQKTITDHLFDVGGGHQPNGAYQSIFGLAVHPDYQKRGIGAQLMKTLIETAKDQGRKGLILTCKDHKIAYYKKFGFKNLGVSDSVHGGAVWYDMLLELNAKTPVPSILTRCYTEADLPEMNTIWNTIVEEGVAFPQLETLTLDSGRAFFGEQSYCGIAENTEGEILGLYILHPNNVGRCGHLCNASYAVKKGHRGEGIGEWLVLDCIKQARRIGFKILQFNAVVKTNHAALKLYRRLGFTPLGEIPEGFLMKDGHYETIIPHYKSL